MSGGKKGTICLNMNGGRTREVGIGQDFYLKNGQQNQVFRALIKVLLLPRTPRLLSARRRHVHLLPTIRRI